MKFNVKGMLLGIHGETLIEGIAKSVTIEFSNLGDDAPEGLEANLKLASMIMTAMAEKIEELSHNMQATADFSNAIGLNNIIKIEKNPDIETLTRGFMKQHKCDNPNEHYSMIKEMLSKVIFTLANNDEFKRHGAH